MKIGVIGAGYVGLVTGTCLAEMGNHVTIVDIAAHKIDALRKGQSPHFEPGLEELLQRNTADKRLAFDTDVALAIKGQAAIFLAVGTPMGEDGGADLSYIMTAAEMVGKNVDAPCTLIIKSTVPVGTNRAVRELLDKHAAHPCRVVSNPEFLKEGAAIEDFMRPDRVVVGVRCAEAEAVMREIYSPFLRTGHPMMVMDPESAEMVKYASNALLASRISFMNEMSGICAKVGADIESVRKGVGADRRIGGAFLFPGLGYGGSCFPKDVRALSHIAASFGLPALICDAIDAVNRAQHHVLLQTIEAELGADLSGKRIALWGLAFKPRTDDVREAPALTMARLLVERGAEVVGYDPEAMETTRAEVGDLITYAPNRDDALTDADALVIATEWNEFRSPDFAEMGNRMRRRLVFDGRNLYELSVIQRHGFTYYSVGRPVVRPA